MSTDALPLVSIIFPVKNEGENVKNTLDSLFSVQTDYPFEVIIADDFSEDGCCDFLIDYQHADNIKLVKTEGLGAAMARNVGADHAKGNYLIFCDAHLFFEDYWIDRMMELIIEGTADAVNPGIADAANQLSIGYGYHWNQDLEPKWNIAYRSEPYPSPLLAGGCLAITREAFFDIGGFERGFQVWGREDEEISLKLWLFGYKCYIQPNVKVLHIFRTHDSPFTLTWENVNFNTMQMAYSHFNESRIQKCKELLKNSDPDKIDDLVKKGNVLKQRQEYFQRRKYDDDWFMEKFKIEF
ncbi:glycosyltransferase involved in cell wall biosynthesis [Bacillus fengqiuensis]|nr:glycosyltransferase involved in cell wall biosynthesis [Bacillus fengqiuensis]